jgi:hypothetical protein
LPQIKQSNCLIFGHYRRDDKDALGLFRAESDFVPRLELVQQRRIPNLENHAHGGHFQIFDLTVFDGYFLVCRGSMRRISPSLISTAVWAAMPPHTQPQAEPNSGSHVGFEEHGEPFGDVTHCGVDQWVCPS